MHPTKHLCALMLLAALVLVSPSHSVDADEWCREMTNYKVYIHGEKDHYGHGDDVFSPPNYTHKIMHKFEVENWHGSFTEGPWVPKPGHEYCGGPNK